MKIRISTTLEKGNRDNNEDALVYCPDLIQASWQQDGMNDYIALGECGSIAVVADGMGGANAGEVASNIAISTIQDVCSPERVDAAVKGGEDTVKSLLVQAIKQADTAIMDRMSNDADTQGMGTTIVVCWAMADKVHIAWCGDSRCYSYHPKMGLTPLTRDHSLVQEMIDRGELTIDEAFTHPDSNVITRGLGDFAGNIEPELVTCPVRPGEIFMLCSDGLCGYCYDDEIEQILDQTQTDTADSCSALMNLSLDAGGNDNIAIVVMSMIGDDLTAPRPISASQRMFRAFKRLF